MKDLAIIMPVYNEEGAIEKVIEKWVAELDKLNIDYNIFAYNDGSKDNTANILERISQKYNKVVAVNKENSGHGPTILKGYRDNSENFNWLFQLDSDDEICPEGFSNLWNKRNEYDFLVGIRDGRLQPLPRKIISLVSRFCIKIFYGKGPWDVNSPYRLMRTEKFKELYVKIPEGTFAPNVIISGFVAKKELKFFETTVPCGERQTGEVSIKKWKLFKAAAKSFWQTISFSFEI